MNLGQLSAEGYLKLLLKLQGSGYSSEPESVRYGELTAIAKAAAMATEALGDAFANLFLTSANSALDLYERTLYLVQGGTISIDERRKRLLAFRQGSWTVEARLDQSFANYLNDTTGSTQRPTEAEARAHGASPGAGLLVSRREPALATKLQARDLTTTLERGLPARAQAGGVSNRDAVWGDALDPAGIAMAPAVVIPPQTKARVAPLKFPPGSVLTGDQWVELQSTLMWKSHGFSQDQASQGRTIFVSKSIAGGGAHVDSSIDWSNRFVQLWGVSGSATSDPALLAGAGDRLWMPPSKTGPAADGYVHVVYTRASAPTASQFTVRVDTTGRLIITNNGGTTQLRAMVRSTAKYVPGSTTDTQPWANTTQPTHDGIADLFAAQVISGDTAGQYAGAGAGAIRRVVYSGALLSVDAPAIAIPQSVILDSSEDWRNRWVVVSSIGYGQGQGIVPPTNIGVPSTMGLNTTPSRYTSATTDMPRLFYTGPGTLRGQPTQLPYQQALHQADNFATTDVWIYADTAGNLCCEMKAGLSYHYTASMLALVIATERDNGASVVTPAPVHATQVQTIDLEQPQHCGSFQQGRQGNVPRYTINDPAPRDIPTCPPLGVISDGNSPVRPVAWMVRERLGGRLDDKYESRQSLHGQRKRVVSIRAPSGQRTPVDDFNLPALTYPPGVTDQMDFRDRIIWVEGRVSPTNITVSSSASDIGGTPFLAVMFTGPATLSPLAGAIFAEQRHSVQIVSVTSGIWVYFEFTRGNPGQGFHSRLVIENNSGVDQHLNFTVEVSGFLGLADRRAAGQPVA